MSGQARLRFGAQTGAAAGHAEEGSPAGAQVMRAHAFLNSGLGQDQGQIQNKGQHYLLRVGL